MDVKAGPPAEVKGLGLQGVWGSGLPECSWSCGNWGARHCEKLFPGDPCADLRPADASGVAREPENRANMADSRDGKKLCVLETEKEVGEKGKRDRLGAHCKGSVKGSDDLVKCWAPEQGRLGG